tara:strand:+ start:292 stop:1845 length:1554 start_codon:yes stop_codon:yes gene_type:complete
MFNKNISNLFEDLIILDIANNHMGDFNHFNNIIDKFSKKLKKFNDNGLKIAFKFQYRDLDTFIHRDFHDTNNNKYVKRFSETKLSYEQYKEIQNKIKYNGFKTICTPFDENSVTKIIDHNFDYIKIASASVNDWPLLEKISSYNKPIIFSVGGKNLNSIDKVTSFFEHKGCDFAILYCVAIYPSENNELNLNKISFLKERYPDKIIGWSTHEKPDELNPVSIAYSLGARVFERHIGLAENNYKLNEYSSNEKQIESWLNNLISTKKILGNINFENNSSKEISTLKSLQRGVFVNKNLDTKQTITSEDIYYAFPCNHDQISTDLNIEGAIIKNKITKDSPLMHSDVNLQNDPDYFILKNAVYEVKALLNSAKVFLNSNFEIEYSHHYGMKNFLKYGTVLINCFNREYAKKVIVQLPGQSHPLHYHKIKEETFQVIHGCLDLIIEDKIYTLNPGDIKLVQPGTWHGFKSNTGCVFEEISTKDYGNDSFYKDKEINSISKNVRKSLVNHWGRFEIKSTNY